LRALFRCAPAFLSFFFCIALPKGGGIFQGRVARHLRARGTATDGCRGGADGDKGGGKEETEATATTTTTTLTL